MIQFDKQGYIIPADVVEINFDEFQSLFVFNELRLIIFQEYLVFLDELKDLKIGSFYQWLDGSFTTLKSNPNDLDVVTFVDTDEYKKNLKYFDFKYSNRYSNKIDCYFLGLCSENHPNFNNFRSDYLDFYHKFLKDRKLEVKLSLQNRSISNRNFKKGFVKINF